MKENSILLALTWCLLTFTFSCKNIDESKKNIDFKIKKDTLTSLEVEKHIASIKKTEIKNKKIYLDFYFGQSTDSVVLLQKKYIKERKIYMKKVKWDKTPHFFSNIPLEITNVTTMKKSVLKTDIRFNMENGKLVSIMLELFSERNFVPIELKKVQKNNSLKELEDNLLNKSNSMDLDSEMKKRKSYIENISYLYVNEIYVDIKQLYKSKYGNPIYIKNELRIENPFNDVNYDKSDPLNLLWLIDGKYIKFNFIGSYSISLDYYNSDDTFNSDDVLIGSIFYNTIENEIDSIRNLKKIDNNDRNKKIDSSFIRERKRAEEIGI